MTCTVFEAAPLVVEAPGDVGALHAAAGRAAAHWHLDTPVLLRIGANGVFTCGEVVLRVSLATAPMDVALRFADRLAAVGVRAPRPARADWLLDDTGLSVTAWQRIVPEPDASVDWEAVGRMVAAVHELDPHTVDHPLPYCADFPWWRFDELWSEVDRLDIATRRALARARDQHGWWVEAARQRPLVLCHGDVHPGNVMVDAHGPVLLDWDLLCVGPAAWDHAPLMTWTQRWGGEAGIYEAFSSGYRTAAGAGVDADIATAVAEMRLLAATLMRLRRARVDPAAAAEAERRLAYWRGDRDAPMWQAQ